MPDGLALTQPRPSSLTLRLGLMFWFETAGVAAYAPLLSHHMQRGLGLGPYEMSLVYATGPLASLFAPLAVGWAADRMFPAERLLALLSLLRAVALLLVARADTFPELLACMALVGLCATPSAVLTSSICLCHMPDARRFGNARVWGTASWLATLWVVSAFLERAPAAQQTDQLRGVFVLSAAMAAALGLYALSLPHTPPARMGRGPLEAVAALGMLKDRRFLSLFAVATAAGALFQINVILQGLFFTSSSGLGLLPAAANRASSVSQLLELGLFPLLSLLLVRFGTKPVLLVGVLSWPLRFLVYSWGQPAGLVVFAQLLHGFNVVLGYFALQIAVDELAPRDRRASSQALLAMGGAGVGALSGQLACGLLLSRYASPERTDWHAIFAFPLCIGLLAVALLWFGFRPREAQAVRS